MKKTFPLSVILLLFVLQLLSAYGIEEVKSFEHPIKKLLRENGMVTKEEGNLKLSFSKTLGQSEQDELIARSKECIERSLEIIQESSFDDSIHLLLVPTRNDMKNIIGGPIGGANFPKDYAFYPENGRPDNNYIYAVYGGKHNALGHEIMHMVTFLKWGLTYCSWLDEGLATYSSPEAENCDGYTFEERYVYFLQNEKLIMPDSTMNFYMKEDGLIPNKIFYSQMAYIVGSLIDNYGIGKLKILWKSSMENFEEIYGNSFENCLQKINDKLNKKYPDLIKFNWEAFTENCIK
ncbi:MAG: hypothetical protein PHX22_08010 [Dysgonamonadaceae bacterium]|nr:hypothetical protein [Dysgonamonadaceae bacterium]MDD4399636.1 hypothetical protein [Dysgonamonadaceae bacterium]